ncbi:tripartite tricarboxylate transporter substrate binding protein [Falsiroseomonas sp.]|uniref:tripartite tricarboxylate transporter substrate binding protein n=1 Tax=Falsiroseomonas sp. TaxID=2870721 RepID=UPI003566EB04
MNRRTLLGALALAPLSRPALAQSWPPRPVRIVVPFAPGSFTDVSARLLANELTGQLGQQTIVENRTGAGGTVGATAVVRAEPDGTTLLLTDNSLAISPGLYRNLPYDPLKDLAQISRIANSPSILLLRPGLGPKTVAELVAYAKSRPGEVTFGSGGQGSSAHLAMELLLNVADIRALHVPFRGVAAAIADVIAGRVDMAIASLASGVRHVTAGTLLGLGVTGEQRSPLLPEVPTFIEAGLPRYDMSYWWGIAAPAATPPDIIARLNREIVQACAQPGLREAFEKQAATAVTSTPEEMARFVEREIGVWREVIARAGVRIE